MELWEQINGRVCSCGRIHRTDIRVLSGRGVLNRLPEVLSSLGGSRPFVLSDVNTHRAAGGQVCRLLEGAGLAYSAYCLRAERPVPDEATVGAVLLHFDPRCDCILAVGSGVINDVGKLLATVSGRPYVIVATAPSMDGYASATSSMERDGLKVSVPTRAPEVIIGEAQILCAAPEELMRAGLGDMLAKYVSLCEWRIARLLLDEYYCEQLAGLVRTALKRCVDNAGGLLQRQEEAVMAVFDGLVLCGIAMNYAGISRPASGNEHYISHVLDMRGVSLGTPTRLHGIQVAVGTLIIARLYDRLRLVTPNRALAEASVAAFDLEAYKKGLRALLGHSAEAMIEQEKREGKYQKATHPARLQKIVENWPQLLQIIEQELPPADRLEAVLKAIGAPTTLEELGTDSALLPQIFEASRDIRDKYVLSRLCWDLGITGQLLREAYGL